LTDAPPRAKNFSKDVFSGGIINTFAVGFENPPKTSQMTVFVNTLSRFVNVFSSVLLMLLLSIPGFAQQESSTDMDTHETSADEKFDAGEVIIHHVLDDHIWHFWDGHGGTLYLPVIVYSEEKGLDVFSSSRFYDENHDLVAYDGYTLEHNHIYLNGEQVFDLSITKNVAMLLINATLMVIVFLAVAGAYKRNQGKAPRGLQSFIEPIIVFVRDEVVKPNIGHGYEKYMPYLLTLFFFILFGNILGLLPGAANLTGNIAVTFTLALITFIVTNVSGNKAYWSHIFWTPGVPLPLRIVILPVEILGIFTKPISLMVRLFVAITAGHIVILSLIALTFIFQSYLVGIASSLVVLFINLIELLVAGIQAYVFTLFTSLYIGMATTDHEHH
jgi:F-type H+-transporting ATPase subunit a